MEIEYKKCVVWIDRNKERSRESSHLLAPQAKVLSSKQTLPPKK